jgi:hypothetical protein
VFDGGAEFVSWVKWRKLTLSGQLGRIINPDDYLQIPNLSQTKRRGLRDNMVRPLTISNGEQV